MSGNITSGNITGNSILGSNNIMSNTIQMSNPTIQVFEHPEFGSLDVLLIDGKPFFPATECAKVLGYKNPHDAILKHCLHLAKREVKVPAGRKPDGTAAYRTMLANFIPEGDLYRLIIRSKLPAAIHFEAWLCDTVLVSIRQHGAYISKETLRKMEADKAFADGLLNKLSAAQAENDGLRKSIEDTTKKMGYFNKILTSTKGIAVTVIAKDYGMTAAHFNALLHDLGIQFKRNGTWVLYSEYAKEGYTVTHTHLRDGVEVWVHTYWTQKGRKWLYERLKCYGYVPVVERMEGLFDRDELFEEGVV